MKFICKVEIDLREPGPDSRKAKDKPCVMMRIIPPDGVVADSFAETFLLCAEYLHVSLGHQEQPGAFWGQWFGGGLAPRDTPSLLKPLRRRHGRRATDLATATPVPPSPPPASAATASAADHQEPPARKLARVQNSLLLNALAILPGEKDSHPFSHASGLPK